MTANEAFEMLEKCIDDYLDKIYHTPFRYIKKKVHLKNKKKKKRKVFFYKYYNTSIGYLDENTKPTLYISVFKIK